MLRHILHIAMVGALAAGCQSTETLHDSELTKMEKSNERKAQIITRLRSENRSLRKELAAASTELFAYRRDTCALLQGAIMKPGVYPIPCGGNLGQLIDLAGGRTMLSHSTVVIHRGEVRFVLDLDDPESLEILIKPGDVVDFIAMPL